MWTYKEGKGGAQGCLQKLETNRKKKEFTRRKDREEDLRQEKSNGKMWRPKMHEMCVSVKIGFGIREEQKT